MTIVFKMKYYKYSKLICLVAVLYINICYGQNDNIDINDAFMNNAAWLENPSRRGSRCSNEMNQMDTTESFFGFSMTIDDSNQDDNRDYLYVGAPGCNGLYKCPAFRRGVSGDDCIDVSQTLYVPNNPGNYNFCVVAILKYF
jgi:hypothetical protein